ncbi:hypothetical protein HNQ80_004325 [Anaerosolibacter carboniphilus]|uniref:Uncharacterized protein n=1 Tax=Anaerosolibacter carboniphilus TaxID=1417629 RepID=A0A841L7D8_9FIRM|nr:hypothetical protein [Anaerosolibacter carboniphilus]MBB6218185.1 hypothetical protein [Anaerosolibacter carboniphilus]
MVTLKDITAAVNTKIEENFPEIKIETRDITEGFDRPSFFTDIDYARKGSFMDSAVERSMTVRIHYFASNRNKHRLELLDVQEKLEDMFFQTLEIKDQFIVHINETNVEKLEGGIIEFSFDINYIEELEIEDPSELMDGIEVSIR